MITEEKASGVTNTDVENYHTDNYELWLGVKEIIDKLPSRKLDPLDATQEFIGVYTPIELFALRLLHFVIVENKLYVFVKATSTELVYLPYDASGSDIGAHLTVVRRERDWCHASSSNNPL